MKIQCDVCCKDDAAILCPADEAALCKVCDHHVHHANKLAGKHHRFPLLQPPPKEIPLCDICQEKRVIVFCQQDRALLCEDCDVSIHKSNEHTINHNRFLITRIMISTTPTLHVVYSSPSYTSSVADNNCNIVPNFIKPQKSITIPDIVPSFTNPQKSITIPDIVPSLVTDLASNSMINVDKGSTTTNPKTIMNGVGNGSTSSISEYLTEILPGWQVEDFLDSSSAPQGYCKAGKNDLLPLWSDDLDTSSKFSSSENIGICVPQAPTPEHQPQPGPSSHMALRAQICYMDPNEATTNIKYSNSWRYDGGFTAPQIRPPIPFKRYRATWY